MFLDHWEKVDRLLLEAARLANDLVQIDIERASEMAKYHALCVDCAKEHGKDPKLCDSLLRDRELASP